MMNQCYIVSVNGLKPGGIGQSVIVDPEGNIIQQANQLPENMIAMLDLDKVRQVRRYGTCGVSRAMTSYLHETHRFRHQREAYEESALSKRIDAFHQD